MNIEEKIKKLEVENKEIKEKLNEVIKITKDYYNFWLHGTALEPIYKEFVDKLDALIIT